MSVLRGLTPGCCIVCIVAALPVTPIIAETAESERLSIAAAESMALASEPGRLALLAQADAMRQQAVAAGALPDPMLRLGLMNYPLETGGFSTEGMTQVQVGIRQSFPPGQSRSVATRRYEIQAQALAASAEHRAREVVHHVRRSWLETWYFGHARATVTQMRPLFADLVDITTSLYSVGNKDQQDVLRAELELARLDDRAIELERGRASARAMLAQWLPAQAARPLAEALPHWPELPPLERLQQQVSEHPAMRAASEALAASSAGVELARQQYKPGWALDVGYAYRDGRLPNGDSRSDFVSVGVTVDLPFFRSNRQDRRVAAAVSERRAARDSREALLLKLSSELQLQYARWHDLSRRLQLYDDVVLPATGAQASAALTAYQSDAGDFADVMRSAIAELDTRLQYLRLQVDRAQAWAAVANLGGVTP